MLSLLQHLPAALLLNNKQEIGWHHRLCSSLVVISMCSLWEAAFAPKGRIATSIPSVFHRLLRHRPQHVTVISTLCKPRLVLGLWHKGEAVGRQQEGTGAQPEGQLVAV